MNKLKEEINFLNLHLEDVKTFLKAASKNDMYKNLYIKYAKESYKIYKAEGGTEVFKELEEIINIIEVEEIKNNIITAHDTNTGEYYIELIGEYEGSYILDINNNKLIKSYNDLRPLKDILISESVKNYIIELIGDDLPF